MALFDVSSQSSALDAIEHAGSIDDRKMLVSSRSTWRTELVNDCLIIKLENLITFMASNPSGKISNIVRTFVIKNRK